MLSGECNVSAFPLGRPIRDMLMQNQTLTEVSILVQHDTDIQYLAEGLKVNTTLQSLNLNFLCRFRGTLLDALGVILDALKRAPRVNFNVLAFVLVGALGQIRNELHLTMLHTLGTCFKSVLHFAIFPWNDAISGKRMRFACGFGMSCLTLFSLDSTGGCSIQSLRVTGDTTLDDGPTPRRTSKYMELLTNETSSVQSLILEDFGINTIDFGILAKAVRDSASLEELKVEYFAEEALPIVVLRMIMSAKRLSSLDLSCCNIGASGAKAVASAPMSSHGSNGNDSISNLSLNLCGLGNEGATFIAEMVSNNKTLKNISLDRNNIGNDGAMILGKCLPRNTTLKRISLDGNEIGEEGLEVLTTGLGEQNTSIEEFVGIPTNSLRSSERQNTTLH